MSGQQLADETGTMLPPRASSTASYEHADIRLQPRGEVRRGAGCRSRWVLVNPGCAEDIDKRPISWKGEPYLTSDSPGGYCFSRSSLAAPGRNLDK